MENFGNMMKSQMLTIGAMKNDGNMVSVIMGIIFMTIMEHFLKLGPMIGAFLKEMGTKYFEQKKNEYLPEVLKKDTIKSSIKFDRKFKNDESDANNNEIVDSVIDYMCKQDTATKLVFANRFMLNNNEKFQVTKDIQGILHNLNYDTEGTLVNMVFEIFSEVLTLSELRSWVNNIHYKYQVQKKNNLGDRKYYFNEIPQTLPYDQSGGYRFDTANPNLMFSMSEFYTNKQLSNIFGKYVDVIRNRVDLFINNPEWYKKRGIPHTLGILLHGPPGCGKTSLIKAIAKDTERHIINISLRETTTQSQLRNLFFNENMTIIENRVSQNILIPLDQRLYVIEDIDCMTDVVIDREIKDKEEQEKKEIEETKPQQIIKRRDLMFSDLSQLANTGRNTGGGLDALFGQSLTGNTQPPVQKQNKDSPKLQSSEKLTLSFLLNLLDGVLETPGRILIMTSNYPEKLDKALIRPGRVDLSFTFGKADTYMIKKMFEHFYDSITIDEEDIMELDDIFTPAELINILCMNYTDHEKALEILKTKSITNTPTRTPSLSLTDTCT